MQRLRRLPTLVDTLIKSIRDLAHDVEDIFDIFLPQIEAQRSSGLLRRTIHIFPYGRTCSKFSKEIEKIKKRVQAIDENRKIYGVEEIPGRAEYEPNVDPRTTTLHFDDPVIVGFDRDIGELETKLKGYQFVSIVGMPGLGKTTLAKKVFKGVKNSFDCSASVSVSQEPNIKSLLQDIAIQVGLEKKKQEENLKRQKLKEKQEENLEINLHSFLQEKTYILFLDDIWSSEAWDSLKECFPINSESASRIIITSRHTGVGRYIGGENSLHQLHPFDDKTSWELFSELITPPSELEKIGEKIVEKCGGIPLAIVVTVGMLRERGMNEFGWNEVLRSIGQDASDKCSQILRLSYMDLPTALKPCFLYFGNFPEDYEFSASQLIKLWMAEKFIPAVGVREPEDVGDDYISKLDARNLIQVVKREHDGRVKKFRVHDLLCSLSISIGREIDFLDTIDHLRDASSAMRVRRLAIHQPHSSIAGDDDTQTYNMPKIRTLFHLKLEEKLRKEHLKKMLGIFKLLRVLILERYGTLDLPIEIGSLRHLKYLQLKAKYIRVALSFQNLKNLQTFYVRQSWLIRLPIEIWKMKQLRHVNLECYVELIKSHDYYLRRRLQFQQVEDSSPNIQTFAVRIGWGFQPRMLHKFNNLRRLMVMRASRETMEVICGGKPISERLETLHCSSEDLIERVVIGRVNLSQYDMLTELKLKGMALQMPAEPLELPPSLIKLTLGDTKLTEDPMVTLKLLPKLKILKMRYNSYVGSKMDCSGADSFPRLQVLKLQNLHR